MTWVDDMKRDAVALAFPDWVLRESDVVDLEMDEGMMGYSTLTPGEPPCINVTITRDEKVYGYSSGPDFFCRLMTKGSEH